MVLENWVVLKKGWCSRSGGVGGEGGSGGDSSTGEWVMLEKCKVLKEGVVLLGEWMVMEKCVVLKE